jgi:hypothetical protein
MSKRRCHLVYALQGFYDPVNDRFTEPKHTGISYSFTADGHFEEAYYRAIANRTFTVPTQFKAMGFLETARGYVANACDVATNPKCPKGIIQWQHGSFTKFANGSLILSPIAVDGRQLYSDPCSYKNAVYTRYNATEKIKVRSNISITMHYLDIILTNLTTSVTKSFKTSLTTPHASTFSSTMALHSCLSTLLCRRPRCFLHRR